MGRVCSIEDEELKRIRESKLRELMMRSREMEKKKERGVISLNASNFDEMLKKTNMPLLVDFWAGWCGPCIMVAPVIEELARDYADKAVFAKLNVDENPEIASRYNVMSIPLFMIFKDGKPVEKIVGAVGRGPLEKALEKYI